MNCKGKRLKSAGMNEKSQNRSDEFAINIKNIR